MKGMNELNLKAVRDEAMKLHFQHALDLLNPYSLQELGFEGILLKTKILRGTYSYAGALELALVAVGAASDRKEALQAMMEQARCLFALNRSEEALQILQPIADDEKISADYPDLYKEARMQTALICSEIGRVEEALGLVKAAATDENLEEASEEKIRKAVDTLCLMGDLFSYKSSMLGNGQDVWFTLAQDAYDIALNTCMLLPESDFRSLRLGLIYNNRADLFEGLELYEIAGSDYENALNQVMPIEDPQIFDLNGYKADMLMSLGNFFSLKEDEASALRFLEQAQSLIEEIYNPQQESYLAKCLYLKGMCRLYSSEDAAQDDLEKSCALYEKLVSEGRDKSERLANARFYLAGVLSDSRENMERKRKLYSQVLPVFERIWQRNPQLYLSNMAALYNDLGRLCYFQNDPDGALKDYQEGQELYQELYTLDPDDLFALYNLVVTRFNIITASFRLPQEGLGGLHLKLALEELNQLRERTEDYDPEIWSLLSASRETLSAQLPEAMKDYDALLNDLKLDEYQA